MSWEKVCIKDVALGIFDGPHATPPEADSGAVFLGISNFVNGQLDLSDIRYISEEDLPKWTRRVTPQANDIVFSYEATLNLYAIIPQSFRGCLGRRMALIRPDTTKVNYKYLYYYFYSKAWRDIISENTVLGATVDRIPLVKFPNFEIELPPMETQNRIADILFAYDNLIENNQKQIKLLEEAAQRLYKEWFVDLHFSGYENTPIVDGVPQGWEESIFSDVFDFIRGKSYTSKELSETEGVLMVNLKNIKSYGGYKRNAEKRFTGAYKDEQLLVGGDVVMGVTDMTQERRLVGHVALIPSINEKMTFSMDLIKLIPYSISKNYLYCALRYGGYSEQIAPLANGVNVLHLKPESMMKMKMLVPPKYIIEKFDNQFEAIRLKIEALEKQCDLAAQARDRLLPKLMSGELEV